MNYFLMHSIYFICAQIYLNINKQLNTKSSAKASVDAQYGSKLLLVTIYCH